jgi:hypothetical protein
MIKKLLLLSVCCMVSALALGCGGTGGPGGDPAKDAEGQQFIDDTVKKMQAEKAKKGK